MDFSQNIIYHDFGIPKYWKLKVTWNRLYVKENTERKKTRESHRLHFAAGFFPPFHEIRYWVFSSMMMWIPQPQELFCAAPSKYALGSMLWLRTFMLGFGLFSLSGFSGKESKRDVMLWRVPMKGSLLSLKTFLFLHRHMHHKAIIKIGLQDSFCPLHQKNASFEDEWETWGKPYRFSWACHNCCVFWQRKNMWQFVSSSNLHIEQRPGPCQPLFLKLSQDKFLLWNTSHEK